MHSTPFRPEFSSTGAVAGRLPATARVLTCISHAPSRTALDDSAGAGLSAEPNRSLDQATALLLREPTPLVIVDDAMLAAAGNTESGSRPIRDFSAALLGNSGCTQLIVISASGDTNSLPIGLRSEEIASRLTMLSDHDISGTALKSMIAMAIRHADAHQSQRQAVRPVSQSHSLREVLGGSPRMEKLFDSIDAASACDTPILICGEAGTGTSLLANAIHDGSSRAAQPFVRVHSRSLTLEHKEEFRWQLMHRHK